MIRVVIRVGVVDQKRARVVLSTTVSVDSILDRPLWWSGLLLPAGGPDQHGADQAGD